MNNSDETLSRDDLSEGEFRLLAFLHFYYDLFDDTSRNLRNNFNTVIVDDPITSLDANNRYYITELINDCIKLAMENQIQLFIFTHSSLDFHNFGYLDRSKKNNSGNPKLAYWRINKNELGNSEVVMQDANELRNYSDYYKSLFQSVTEFALISKARINEEQNFIHYGNQARLVFESHARSHYSIENVTNSALNQLIEVYNIPEAKEEKFKSMLDVINSLSHGFSIMDISNNSKSPEEIQKAIRTMLGVLYIKDPEHVRAMSNGDLNKKVGIKSWF